MGRAMAANSFSYVMVLIMLSATGVTSSSVPAIFGFGDSTIDVGTNNNFRVGLEKANFKPYGIDYPNSQSTGRFSNGYNIIDFIAQYVGFKESPPAYFPHAKNKHVELNGANFASAGSGILESVKATFSIPMQIEDFESHKAKMVAQLGEAETMRLLAYSLFIISTGSNDVINFYKNLPNLRDRIVKQGSFIKIVTSNYKKHIVKLYNLGARKFVIFNVGIVGCYPISRSLYSNNGKCNGDLNQLAYSVNIAIRSVLSDLSRELEWMHFSIGSTYEVMSVLEKNRPDGLEVEFACCGERNKKCSPGDAICERRDKYMFWDMLHLTEKVTQMAGLLFFNGSNNYTSPINIKGLVQIH